MGARSDRNDEQDSSEPKVSTAPKDNDRGDGPVMDRATMESMASLFAAVVPVPLPVTVALSGGSSAEATAGPLR